MNALIDLSNITINIGGRDHQVRFSMVPLKTHILGGQQPTQNMIDNNHILGKTNFSFREGQTIFI
jgi:hypothetical protein